MNNLRFIENLNKLIIDDEPVIKKTENIVQPAKPKSPENKWFSHTFDPSYVPNKYSTQEKYNHTRVNKATTENILLFNRNPDDETTTFRVMGATGKVYDVKLENKPTCTCPDHIERNIRCKHILFILIKIFEMQNMYQNTFTKEEIINYIRTHKYNIIKYNIKNENSDSNIQYKKENDFEECIAEIIDIINNPHESMDYFEKMAKGFISFFMNEF